MLKTVETPQAEPTLEAIFGDGLMTTEQARAYLNVSESTFNALIYSGAIGSVKVGGGRRVPKKMLATYLQSRLRPPKVAKLSEKKSPT